LVGYERRHIDEIARTGFGGEFQPLAPTHARLAAHHVDDALELAVVMCPGLGVGANVDGACPNLLGADAGIVDRSLAIHARRLRGVGIKRMPRNAAHAVVLPFGRRFAVGFDVHVVALVCVMPGPTRASWLLSPPRRTRKSFGLFRGAEQRFGLVDAFLLLEL